jgi:hypothetical protein
MRAKSGAGYGDRTRLTGLGSQGITTMLSPRARPDSARSARAPSIISASRAMFLPTARAARTSETAGRQRTWHLARGTWHVAPRTWHVAPRTWHVAPRTWHLARGTWHPARGTWHVARHARMTASTSSRFFSISSGVVASRFRRSIGSVFDARTLKCQSGYSADTPSS